MIKYILFITSLSGFIGLLRLGYLKLMVFTDMTQARFFIDNWGSYTLSMIAFIVGYLGMMLIYSDKEED